MITIHIFILLALALFGAYVAYKSRQPVIYFIITVALIMAAAGVYTSGIYPAPGDVCLVNTTESSLYWNCTGQYQEDPYYYNNVTCDSVNVTYTYDYCEAAGDTTAEANGVPWATLMAMLSLVLLAGGLLMYLKGGDYGAAREA